MPSAAKFEFDDEAEIFYGEVIGIRDVVTFQATTAKELKKAFKESVDEYLSFCKERCEAPDRPFAGRFASVFPLSCTERFICPQSFPTKASTPG